MKAVGIKELKARLSEYVRSARAGESILVTDRSEVVAELGPARRGAAAPETELEQALATLEARGLVTPSRLEKQEWRWRHRSLGLPAGSALAILAELRADRRP